MRLVCHVPTSVRPLISPPHLTRPHGGVALAASRSRSNESPRQIEDGAHKLLRAATSCACLELARARRRHLKPARPQRCQSLARAACSTLSWLLSLLDWTKVPHALSGHPICWSRSNGRSLAGGVQARLRQCIQLSECGLLRFVCNSSQLMSFESVGPK